MLKFAQNKKLPGTFQVTGKLRGFNTHGRLSGPSAVQAGCLRSKGV
jgi:hypothetical protein